MQGVTSGSPADSASTITLADLSPAQQPSPTTLAPLSDGRCNSVCDNLTSDVLPSTPLPMAFPKVIASQVTPSHVSYAEGVYFLLFCTTSQPLAPVFCIVNSAANVKCKGKRCAVGEGIHSCERCQWCSQPQAFQQPDQCAGASLFHHCPCTVSIFVKLLHACTMRLPL